MDKIIIRRRDYMIISEFNKENSTIRIHDDFCENKIENRLSQLNYNVSESYKRRKITEQQVKFNSVSK